MKQIKRRTSLISAWLCIMSFCHMIAPVSAAEMTNLGVDTQNVTGQNLKEPLLWNGLMGTARALIDKNMTSESRKIAASNVGCSVQSLNQMIDKDDTSGLASCIKSATNTKNVTLEEIESKKQAIIDEIGKAQFTLMDMLESELEANVTETFYNGNPEDSSVFDVVFELKKVEAIIAGVDRVSFPYRGTKDNKNTVQTPDQYIKPFADSGTWGFLIKGGELLKKCAGAEFNTAKKGELPSIISVSLNIGICAGVKTVKYKKKKDDPETSILGSAISMFDIAYQHSLEPHTVGKSALGMIGESAFANALNGFFEPLLDGMKFVRDTVVKPVDDGLTSAASKVADTLSLNPEGSIMKTVNTLKEWDTQGKAFDKQMAESREQNWSRILGVSSSSSNGTLNTKPAISPTNGQNTTASSKNEVLYTPGNNKENVTIVPFNNGLLSAKAVENTPSDKPFTVSSVGNLVSGVEARLKYESSLSYNSLFANGEKTPWVGCYNVFKQCPPDGMLEKTLSPYQWVQVAGPTDGQIQSLATATLKEDKNIKSSGGGNSSTLGPFLVVYEWVPIKMGNYYDWRTGAQNLGNLVKNSLFILGSVSDILENNKNKSENEANVLYDKTLQKVREDVLGQNIGEERSALLDVRQMVTQMYLRSSSCSLDMDCSTENMTTEEMKKQLAKSDAVRIDAIEACATIIETGLDAAQSEGCKQALTAVADNNTLRQIKTLMSAENALKNTKEDVTGALWAMWKQTILPSWSPTDPANPLKQANIRQSLIQDIKTAQMLETEEENAVATSDQIQRQMQIAEYSKTLLGSGTGSFQNAESECYQGSKTQTKGCKEAKKDLETNLKNYTQLKNMPLGDLTKATQAEYYELKKIGEKRAAAQNDENNLQGRRLEGATAEDKQNEKKDLIDPTLKMLNNINTMVFTLYTDIETILTILSELLTLKVLPSTESKYGQK